MNIMTAGQRMKEKRKELGLSAEFIADKLRVSPATIYRYEKGDIEKIPGNILEQISKILKTTPAYLMGWEPDDASRIRMAREVSGFTQKKLAQQIGVSVATLDAWERGYAKPRKADFDALAAALDMSPYSLYDNDALASYMNDMVADHGPHIFDLLNHFDQLNDLGQTTAVQRVAELTEIDKYKAELTDDRPHDDDPI